MAYATENGHEFWILNTWRFLVSRSVKFGVALNGSTCQVGGEWHTNNKQAVAYISVKWEKNAGY